MVGILNLLIHASSKPFFHFHSRYVPSPKFFSTNSLLEWVSLLPFGLLQRPYKKRVLNSKIASDQDLRNIYPQRSPTPLGSYPWYNNHGFPDANLSVTYIPLTPLVHDVIYECSLYLKSAWITWVFFQNTHVYRAIQKLWNNHWSWASF